MKYSSARQLALDFDTVAGSDAGQAAASVQPDWPRAASSAQVDFPEFGKYDPVFAATSRIAGRINAANISNLEHEALLNERQKLLDKKFENQLTRKEANRLEYVRWSLDRIEDARHGQVLEFLESSVSRYERLRDDLASLKMKLDEQLPRNRR